MKWKLRIKGEPAPVRDLQAGKPSIAEKITLIQLDPP
jgi:hypothetical protein